MTRGNIYSVARLDPMEATCASERAIPQRLPYAGGMGPVRGVYNQFLLARDLDVP